MRESGLTLDPRMLVDRLLGERRTEVLYKARKSGVGRVLNEPLSRLGESLSDLRVAAMATAVGFLVICLYRELIGWGEEIAKGSPVDAEYDAMEVGIGIGFSMFALWILGSAFKHMSGPEHEDPDRLKQYFKALELLIPDHHADKAAILNPGKDAESCQKFYAFHANALQHLLVTKKNPRAASYVITAIRRRLQHAPMDLEVFERQLGGGMLPNLTWDSMERADSVASSGLRRRLAGLRAADDTEASVAGTPSVGGEDSEGAAVGSMATELAEAVDDTERRQAIIRRLLLSSMSGNTHVERQTNVTALSESDDDRGFISHVNDALLNIQSGGVIGNPAPALFATPFATPLLIPRDDMNESERADDVSSSVSSKPSQARLGVIDHFNLALHNGEYIEALPTVLKGRKYAELMSYNIASRNAREQTGSQLATPAYASLNCPRGYLAEYIFADVGHTLRTHSHLEMQPRLDWLGLWLHYGRQVCQVTQVDRITYDRARVMAQSIRRLLKYRSPFEAEVAGRRHEETLFDRALMFAALLCDVKALDDWQHWSQVDPLAHAVFGMLTTRQQVELSFTLLSGSPFTQLLARALVHDIGERQTSHGTTYHAHTGFSHQQLNKFFKAYLAFMQEEVPGESPAQTDLRNVLFTEHLVLLTDGRQGIEPQDRRMMEYCQAHTRKPLEILTTLVQRLSRMMPSYLQMITLVDGEGNRIELDADDLALQIGAYSEQEDFECLLADIDSNEASAVQQKLAQIQQWLATYQLNADDESLPLNIESIADAARRMEARDKRFAARYVATYRAAKERAVEFFKMLRAGQRGPAMMAMSEVNPESVLPLFDCDTPSTFSTLRMMLPANSDLTLLSTLLQPPLPSRHRQVWYVLMKLLSHNTNYVSAVTNFLHVHAVIMLTEPSFRLMFSVAQIVFDDDEETKHGFSFFILKTISQAAMPTLDKARAINDLIEHGYPAQPIPKLIDTFSHCYANDRANAVSFDHILQQLLLYRQQTLSHRATSSDVIGLLGDSLVSIVSDLGSLSPVKCAVTRCALSAWVSADSPRGVGQHFYTVEAIKLVCQLNDADEYEMLSPDAEQRFEIRQWLVVTVLPTIVKASDAQCQSILMLLAAFAAAYPAKFGKGEFAIVRAVQFCIRALGTVESSVISKLVQYDARFIWIYAYQFVVDPNDILPLPGEDEDAAGLPSSNFDDVAQKIYRLLPANQHFSQANRYLRILARLIWFPGGFPSQAENSCDLGYMLTALMHLDKTKYYEKCMSLMQLQAEYLETKVGATLDEADLDACPVNYRQHLITYIQQETHTCLRDLEQAFQTTVRQPDSVVADNSAIQVYWSDYINQEEMLDELPDNVSQCPYEHRVLFMGWLRDQVNQRDQLEVRMVKGEETADNDIKIVFADFVGMINRFKLPSVERGHIPACPENLIRHFTAFRARFYPNNVWPGNDRDLRSKIWRQFCYATITLNWFSKPWLEAGEPPRMLVQTLDQMTASLQAVVTNECLPHKNAMRLACVRIIGLLYPIYEQALTTKPESQAGQELVQDQFAGAEFTVDEQAAALRVLLALLKLPKPTDEQNRQAILPVAIKLTHVCLSSNRLLDGRFKLFYRDIMPRLMAYLRSLDFQHADDPALLNDLWSYLPTQLQQSAVDRGEVEEDGLGFNAQTQANTLVKKRLSLAYLCWRYDRSKAVSTAGYVANSVWSVVSCGSTPTYQAQDAAWVQGMRDRFCMPPSDLGKNIGTSQHCRAWVNEHLNLALNQPRLVFRGWLSADGHQAELGEAAPLLGSASGGAGIN